MKQHRMASRVLILAGLAVMLFSCGEAPPAIVSFNDALERFPHDRVDTVRVGGGYQVVYKDLRWPYEEDTALAALLEEGLYRTETRVFFSNDSQLLRIIGLEHIFTVTDSSAIPPFYAVRDSVIMELLPEE